MRVAASQSSLTASRARPIPPRGRALPPCGRRSPLGLATVSPPGRATPRPSPSGCAPPRDATDDEMLVAYATRR